MPKSTPLPDWAVVGQKVLVVQRGDVSAVETIHRVTATSAYIGPKQTRYINDGWQAQDSLVRYGDGDSWNPVKAVFLDSDRGKNLWAEAEGILEIRKIAEAYNHFMRERSTSRAHNLRSLLNKFIDGHTNAE